MNRSDIKVGQTITVGFEVEFWNSDDSLDWRTDRWAPFKILSIKGANEDYIELEVECLDGIYSGTIELDLDYNTIELVK